MAHTPPQEIRYPRKIPGARMARPRSSRTAPSSLPKAIWDSIFGASPAPLGDYVWKEWRAVKKYPGALILAVGITALVSWYTTRYWYFSVPYHGPTAASLFFPGDGSDPTNVSKSNVYRLSHFQASMQATIPKDNESVLKADVRFWQVNLVFDKEVDADNSILSVGGLTNESHIEIKDFNRRGALVVITPATTEISGASIQPKGMLEIVVKDRTTNRP